MMKKRVVVAAAVMTREDGRFLLGKRAPDTFYPGYWEFPGGKVEPGETSREALIRELREELGIEAREAWPWITRHHDYEHAQVRLDFFEVPRWSGTLRDHVHSALVWQSPGELSVAPMLPANGPVLKALQLPRQMGITRAWEIGPHRQLAQIEAALTTGLRLIQVRETPLGEPDRRTFAQAVVALARPYDAVVMINGDEKTAHFTGAKGIHLTSAQLAVATARPDFEWVGASCHNRAELERAAILGLDYALLGPVHPTPTHPGKPGLGWETFATMVSGFPLPVLALGGVRPDDYPLARAAGAHGLAGIRGFWPLDES
ncbi:MAG: Nudix family hydrolase [Zoogloeaceae bacterium]|nr:Nudix family hydrolase [Zoogloeaceae bacterium]